MCVVYVSLGVPDFGTTDGFNKLATQDWTCDSMGCRILDCELGEMGWGWTFWKTQPQKA